MNNGHTSKECTLGIILHLSCILKDRYAQYINIKYGCTEIYDKEHDVYVLEKGINEVTLKSD